MKCVAKSRMWEMHVSLCNLLAIVGKQFLTCLCNILVVGGSLYSILFGI